MILESESEEEVTLLKYMLLDKLLLKESLLTIKNTLMKSAKEKLNHFYSHMIEVCLLLIQEDANLRNTEEMVLDQENKRVTDELIINCFV